MKLDQTKSEKLLERRKNIVSNGVGIFNTATAIEAKGSVIIDEDDRKDQSAELPEKRTDTENTKRNHFVVMFVEDMSEEDEKMLMSNLSELKNPSDQFTYSVIVLRSFQDALIALLFNYNIQVVVLRYAPLTFQKKIIPLIKPYVQSVLKLDLSSKQDTELVPILGQLIKQFRPRLINIIIDTRTKKQT